jgi:hypothetical protein
MPTTTNFGWTTPADTDLVKDGAAAIRTVAGNIDTSLVDLKGGTTGQYLAKNSGTDLDYVWNTLPTAGGMTLISETVASALSSLSFSSLGSYKQLLLMYSGIRHSNNSSSFGVRFNNDSTSVYYVAGLQQIGATTDLSATARNNLGGVVAGDAIFAFGSEVGNAALATDVMGSILIDNYTSSTKFKTITTNLHYYASSSLVNVNMNTVHMYGNTTAITSIDIVRLSGAGTFSNSTDTTIRLYGLS